MQGKFELLRLDIDEEGNQELCEQYKVQGVPMMVVFKNGKQIDSFTGLTQEDALRAQLK